MHPAELLTWIVCAATAAGYSFLLLRYALSWKRAPQFVPQEKANVRISVIVPARNEEARLGECLESLCAQSFPQAQFEVLVIDDHSEDATAEIASRYSDRLPLRVLKLSELPGCAQGKKAAVTLGVRQAQYELIVATDADCRAGAEWLTLLAAFFAQHAPKMIIGPVLFHREKNFFGHLQSLEFSALALVAGAAALEGKALLCNGANLAYAREVFEEVNGYSGDAQASGDDVLLLQRVLKKYPQGVKYIKHPAAAVFTEPQRSGRAFFDQRKRWVSKFSAYRLPRLIMTAMLVYGMSFLIVLCGALALLHAALVWPFLLLVVVKAGVDFLFLSLAASFFSRPRPLRFYLPAQLLYSFYVLAVTAGGIGGGYSWKGRSSRSL